MLVAEGMNSRRSRRALVLCMAPHAGAWGWGRFLCSPMVELATIELGVRADPPSASCSTFTLDALLCAQISASNKTGFFLKSNLKFLRGTPWRNILKNWLFLATAIISEVIATSALKSSEGFTRLVPSFIVVAGYAAAFYFLSLTLKSIPVGIAYAVWSGLGIVLVTAIAWVLHGQKLDMWGFVGVGFIISGVAVLNLLSKASVH